jgi:hypothetical protein
MMPNSQIKIAQFVTDLTFHGCNLNACSALSPQMMWLGITQDAGWSTSTYRFTKTSISEAFYGISVGDNPTLLVNKCFFNRNYISISRFDEPDDHFSQDFNHSSAIITGNTFDCTAPLPSNDFVTVERSLYALSLFRGENVRCGTANVPSSRNLIKNHLNGYALQGFTGFIDHYSEFETIQSDPQTGLYGLCIDLYNSVNSTFEHLTIHPSCRKGILTENADRTTFRQAHIDCQAASIECAGSINLIMRASRVSSNGAVAITVFGGNNTRLDLEGLDNIFGFEGGVYVGAGVGRVRIVNVDIIRSQGPGIVMWDRTTPSLIRRCTFSSWNINAPAIGINLTNVSNLQVAGNEFRNLGFGLRTTATNNLFLCQNEFENCTGYGVNMTQNNAGGDFWCTNFATGSDYDALALTHETNIGDEINRANSWTNETAPGKAFYRSTTPLMPPLTSFFRVASNNLDDLDEIFVLDGSSFTFLQPNTWFNIAGTDIACPNINDALLCNGVAPNAQPELEDDMIFPWEEEALSTFDLRPLTEPANFSPSELYIHESQTKHLLERVFEKSSLLDGNNALAEFYNNRLHSDAMKQILLERELELSCRPTQIEYHQMQLLQDTISHLNAATDAIQIDFEAYLAAEDFTYPFSREEELKHMLSQLGTKQVQLKALLNGVRARQLVRFTHYYEQINAMSAEGIPFSSWLFVKRLQGQKTMQSDASFTLEEINAITDLAWKCPWTHGDAVLTAREYVRGWTQTQPNFPEGCMNSERSMQTTSSSLSAVYPNPGDGKAQVVCNANSLVTVSNLLGDAIIFAKSGTSSEKINSIDLSNAPDGLYFIHITENTGATRTHKYIKHASR